MNGIYVEKISKNDIDVWVVRDAKTGELLSSGYSVSSAVSNYETILANEQMAKELGVSTEDMDI